MAELDYVGVRSCGCITAWLSGDHASRSDVRDFYRSMADSGREVRRMTLDDAKASGRFLPSAYGCSHQPMATSAADPIAPGPVAPSPRKVR